MKTFKLVGLKVVKEEEQELVKNDILLKDGLIINREDDANTWLLEAYIPSEQMNFFESHREERDNIVLEATITKPSNQPAMLLMKIMSINTIGEDGNIVFLGTIVNQKKVQAESLLKKLMDDGLQGEQLLQAFKVAVEEEMSN
ncbi:YwpF family protein [Pontibacillus litoralis]|uniref:YwpF n=1 Tax=Pontibacillus litoralis JSM 072002 TaxID=1385512 RepID=A0A0A5G733_9BACI|nr:YwpF family protein [Pontibacillus litoralis]KGX86910.1 hypothetical protein N784_03395 [Pontibacillus litoralis JSM 072002]